MSAARVVESFSVASGWVKASTGLRLDAGYYNPRAARAVEALRHSGMPVKRLGEVTERIFIPPRFKRIYVQPEHGVPFLQGSHIVHFRPADLKHLSLAAHRDLSKWIIRKGWILVTCSGTIGRVTITPAEWEGWAASQHILRIVPKAEAEVPSGYICAYLSSPVGQAQLTAQMYGAVVDELTEGQARDVLVPIPSSPEQRELMDELNALTLEAVQLRARAADMAEKAVKGIAGLVPMSPALVEEPEEEFRGFSAAPAESPTAVRAGRRSISPQAR